MLDGVFVPTFTAFTERGALDIKSTINHAKWLLDSPVDGLVPFGTFGEGASLSLNEMQRITEELLEIRGTKQIIPTIISNSLGTITEFLSWLTGSGVTHVMVLPPSYFRPTDITTMVRLFAEVVASTDINIIAYNIPACAAELPAEVVTHTDVWGVKDSSGDLASTKRYLSTGKNVLIGSEKLFIPALEAGACGGILGLANLFPTQVSEAYRLFQLGDRSAAQHEIDAVLQVVDQTVPAGSSFADFIACMKALSEQLVPSNLGSMRLPVASRQLPVAP
jgi:dihydrodipicolinate synthase/N-acetylneuraminate lyase